MAFTAAGSIGAAAGGCGVAVATAAAASRAAIMAGLLVSSWAICRVQTSEAHEESLIPPAAFQPHPPPELGPSKGTTHGRRDDDVQTHDPAAGRGRPYLHRRDRPGPERTHRPTRGGRGHRRHRPAVRAAGTG